jgi:hypothetical protein
MDGFKQSGWISSLMVVFFFSLFPGFSILGDPNSKPTLTLLVFNYGGFSAKEIRQMGARVSFIMENANIRTNWLDCRPALGNYKVPALCEQPLGPGDLVLRLLDQAAMPATGISHITLAHSFVSEEGGSYGTVFCPIFKQLSGGDKTAKIEFLGHAIAHEIGHLLLGTQAHTDEGIMRPRWNRLDFSRMKTARGLLFSEEEAVKLRGCLWNRQRGIRDSQIILSNGQKRSMTSSENNEKLK